MSAINRREFIKIGGIAVSGFFLGPFSVIARADSTSDLPREIGELYLKSAGQDIGIEEMRAKIQELKEKEKIQDYLAQLIDQDFALNQCFSYHTWILSRTEARLCALALR